MPKIPLVVLEFPTMNELIAYLELSDRKRPEFPENSEQMSFFVGKSQNFPEDSGNSPITKLKRTKEN